MEISEKSPLFFVLLDKIFTRFLIKSKRCILIRTASLEVLLVFSTG